MLEWMTYEEIISNAKKIACTESFRDALNYLHEVNKAESNVFKFNVFEGFWGVSQEAIRSQMYENLLTEPYIYWLELFIEMEAKRNYVEHWNKRNTTDANSIAKFKVYNEISYHMYKNYSRREIVEKISALIYTEPLELESFIFVTDDLECILHYSELVQVWRNVINYYTNMLQENYYDKDDVKYFASAINYVRKGTLGYQVISKYVMENSEKFLPYIDEIPKDTKLAKFLQKQNCENSKED